MSKRKGKGRGDDEAHGILEGISSLHSWIKTQTMIRPTKLGKKKDDMSFDDVSLHKLYQSRFDIFFLIMMMMMNIFIG